MWYLFGMEFPNKVDPLKEQGHKILLLEHSFCVKD